MILPVCLRTGELNAHSPDLLSDPLPGGRLTFGGSDHGVFIFRTMAVRRKCAGRG